MSREPLTEAIQHYLRELYKLGPGRAPVAVGALARAQGVSAASASAMVKKLAALDLAEHPPYGDVSLTPAGERVALEVIRHHRLLELYLAETLGVDVDDVHDEATGWSMRSPRSSRRGSTRRSASRRTIRTGTRSPTRTSSGRARVSPSARRTRLRAASAPRRA